MKPVTFAVRGTPVQKGSKKAFPNPKTGGTILVDDNRPELRQWQAAVRFVAGEKCPALLAGPLAVTISFTFVLPKSKVRKRTPSPTFVEVRPDIDKLGRATLDALKGVAYKDDGQVAALILVKIYGEVPGAMVSIRGLDSASGEA